MKALVLTAAIAACGLTSSWAGSATWESAPPSADWNTSTDWFELTVPNGPNDTATFSKSRRTNVKISDDTEVNGIVFSPGASAFTISVLPKGVSATEGHSLTISGSGIDNQSGIEQNFVVTGKIPLGFPVLLFTGHATAGDQTSFTFNSFFTFLGFSDAGSATFTCNNGFLAFGGYANAKSAIITCHGRGGPGEASVEFSEHASAGDSIITLNSGGNGSFVAFFSGATAAHSTIFARGADGPSEGAGAIFFDEDSTAGHASLIAEGGTNGGFGANISFGRGSDGGEARAQLLGNATLDITDVTARHKTGSLRIGSIEGEGFIYLAAGKLVTGTNDLDTTFAGVIQDQPPNRPVKTGGSLEKIGYGTLTLTNANIYTGSTTVSRGKLFVNNKTGSGTGSGPVQVNAGMLGGVGQISGAVTVGTGNGHAAYLAPGPDERRPGALVIDSTLTFNSLSNFRCVLNRNTGNVSKVKAFGVIINSGVKFVFDHTNAGQLAAGTVLTLIDNTSTSPIFGTFSNLPDQSTFTIGNNIFKADYHGGTGNDLTLTVQ